MATVTATGAGMLMSEEPVVGSSNTDGDFELTGLRAGTYHVAISDFPEGLEFPVTTRDVTVGVGLSANVSFSAPGEDTADTGDTFIFISNIESGAEEGATAHSGQVTVTASVERGTARFEKIELMVDGHVVDVQSFGVPASEPADEPETPDEPEGGDDSDPEMAAAQVFEFNLGFNSAEYDEQTGAVTYENGSHDIQVGLHVTGSESALYSNLIETEIENPDGFIVTADLGDNHHAVGGKTWYGGPGNGDITVTALPVSYSGGSTSTVSLSFCNESDEEATQAEGASAYSADFACKGYTTTADGGDMIAITADGEPGDILNDVAPAYIDNEGPPGSPTILANRNDREDGWINSSVGLSGKFDAKSAKDNWLLEGDKGEGGVGGYNMGVKVGKDLKAALGDDASYGLPAESSAADAYCAVAVARDHLGNMGPMPDADDDTCREAPAGEDVALTINGAAGTAGADTTMVYGVDSNADGNDAIVSVEDVNQAGQTIEFGVDNTAPVVELVTDDEDTRFAALGTAEGELEAIAFEAFDDQNDTGNSGLAGTSGLSVKASRRTATKTDCANINPDGTVGGSADKDCEYTAISDSDVNFVADSTSVAYYTIGAVGKDKAGNSSEPVSHTIVYDNVIATATAPAVPGVIAAGKPFQGATYLNDNLSIRDYYGTMTYGTGQVFGIGMPLAVDAFNAASFTRLNHPVTAVVGLIVSPTMVQDPYATVQTTQGGTREDLSSVQIRVRDQAGAYSDAATGITTVTPVEVPADSLTWETSNATPGANEVDFSVALRGFNNNDDPAAADGYAVCGRPKGCADDDDADNNSDQPTLKIELRADKLASGTFRNPIERVDFWVEDTQGVAWRVEQDSSGTSGRVGGDGANARFRTWSYSVTLPGTAIAMATRPGLGTEVPMIHAVAVNSSGAALMLSASITFGAAAP